MATTKGQQTLIIVAVLAAGGYVVYKLFGKTRSVQAAGGGSTGPIGGYGGGAYYPPPYEEQPGLLSQLLNSLMGGRGGGASSGGSQGFSGPNGTGSSRSPYNGGTMSIAQALATGDYNAGNQNVLAGIFNMQNGAGDFAGDSRQSVSNDWFAASDPANNMGSELDNYFGIPNQDANEIMDLSSVAVPVGDVGDSGGVDDSGDLGGGDMGDYGGGYYGGGGDGGDVTGGDYGEGQPGYESDE